MLTMAERIRSKRIESGLTQEDLGNKLGVKRQLICRWEKGSTANIKRSYIAKMAEIFHCSPVWLMGYETDELVTLTYSAPNKPDTTVEVDLKPIMGESARNLRAELYNVAMNVRPEFLETAINLLKTLI